MEEQQVRLLAIDTANAWGSVALWQGRVLPAAEMGLTTGEMRQRVVHAPDGFGHLLFGELQALLAEAGCEVRQLTAVAVANGPGSFTGIRVAISAAKGLAMALGVPLFGITNLEAVQALAEAAGVRGVPVLAAGRGEYYASLPERGDVVLTGQELGALQEELAAAGARVLVPETGVLPVELRQGPHWESGWGLAASVARLVAEGPIRRGDEGTKRERWGDPAALDAHYVRRSDAEMKWHDS